MKKTSLCLLVLVLLSAGACTGKTEEKYFWIKGIISINNSEFKSIEEIREISEVDFVSSTQNTMATMLHLKGSLQAQGETAFSETAAWYPAKGAVVVVWLDVDGDTHISIIQRGEEIIEQKYKPLKSQPEVCSSKEVEQIK